MAKEIDCRGTSDRHYNQFLPRIVEVSKVATSTAHHNLAKPSPVRFLQSVYDNGGVRKSKVGMGPE
jgi:hypothetical protein